MPRRKRITLHPPKDDGSPNLDVNLYPKTLETAIFDIDGNQVIFQKELPKTAVPGQVLKSTSIEGTVEWGSVGGSGDVIGPSSSTSNSIAVFSGTTGKVIDSSVLDINYNGETEITTFGSTTSDLDINALEVTVTSNNVQYVFGTATTETQKTVAVKEDYSGTLDSETGNWTSITINGTVGNIPTGGGGGGSDGNQKIAVNGVGFGINDTVNFIGSGDVSITANTTNKTITFDASGNYVPKTAETNRIYGTDSTGAQTAYEKSDLIKSNFSDYTLEEDSEEN